MCLYYYILIVYRTHRITHTLLRSLRFASHNCVLHEYKYLLVKQLTVFILSEAKALLVIALIKHLCSDLEADLGFES